MSARKVLQLVPGNTYQEISEDDEQFLFGDEQFLFGDEHSMNRSTIADLEPEPSQNGPSWIKLHLQQQTVITQELLEDRDKLRAENYRLKKKLHQAEATIHVLKVNQSRHESHANPSTPNVTAMTTSEHRRVPRLTTSPSLDEQSTSSRSSANSSIRYLIPTSNTTSSQPSRRYSSDQLDQWIPPSLSWGSSYFSESSTNFHENELSSMAGASMAGASMACASMATAKVSNTTRRRSQPQRLSLKQSPCEQSQHLVERKNNKSTDPENEHTPLKPCSGRGGRKNNFLRRRFKKKLSPKAERNETEQTAEF